MILDKDAISLELLKLVEIVGEDKFLEICRVFGGSSIYIPSISSISKASRDLEIRSKYNGNNERKLACDYGISITHLRRILSKNWNMSLRGKIYVCCHAV